MYARLRPPWLRLAAAAAAPAAPLRAEELSAEEQRTVQLFKQCSGAVVHINTFAPWRAADSVIVTFIQHTSNNLIYMIDVEAIISIYSPIYITHMT